MIKRSIALTGFLCLSLLSHNALADSIHKPTAQNSVQPSSHSTPSTKDVLSALVNDDDASIGAGPNLMVVFMDYGDISMRKQIVPLFAFSQQHPNWKIDIKELPLLNKESLDIALAQVSVVAQQNEAAWRKFEYMLLEGNRHFSPDDLRNMAKISGIDIAAYDDYIKSGKALKKVSYNRKMAESAKIKAVPLFLIDGKVNQGYLSLNDLNQFAVP